MPETTRPNLSSVAETLLITLYIRATESQRPDALINDERAEALVRQLDQETLRKTLALTDDFSRVAVILKGREFDRFAQGFLARHPDAVVVHIGCGLDTRFERVDNGRVECSTWTCRRSSNCAESWSEAKGNATASWLAQCSTVSGWIRWAQANRVLFYSWPKAFLCTSQKRR